MNNATVETTEQFLLVHTPQATIEHLVFKPGSIIGTYSQNTAIHETTYMGVSFSNIRMMFVLFEGCTFYDCIFNHTSLSSCTFHQCLFVNCKFYMSDLTSCSFDNTTFRDTKLMLCQFQSTNFSEWVVKGSSLHKNGFRNALFVNSYLERSFFADNSYVFVLADDNILSEMTMLREHSLVWICPENTFLGYIVLVEKYGAGIAYDFSKMKPALCAVSLAPGIFGAAMVSEVELISHIRIADVNIDKNPQECMMLIKQLRFEAPHNLQMLKIKEMRKDGTLVARSAESS